VQWWWRPFIPFGKTAVHKYALFATPHAHATVPARDRGALTSHGWPGVPLTTTLREYRVRGTCRGAKWSGCSRSFSGRRVTRRAGSCCTHKCCAAISRSAWACPMESGPAPHRSSRAPTSSVGHDHQEGADTLGGHVVVSTAGRLTALARGAVVLQFRDDRGCTVQGDQVPRGMARGTFQRSVRSHRSCTNTRQAGGVPMTGGVDDCEGFKRRLL